MGVLLTSEPGFARGLRVQSLATRATLMAKLLGLGRHEISITFTGDVQIKKLNRLYRHANKPTDVLAFAMQDGLHGDASGRLLGDVIISLETAKRQAAVRGLPVGSEVTMLLAHGILHLLGWDHDTPAKERRMLAETRRLCEAAGDARAVFAHGFLVPQGKQEGPGSRKTASPQRAKPLGEGLKAKSRTISK